ncbi:gamma-glutamylcyclotransferase family protein [Neolewinella antarctica]|uniref:Gamma-glutamylcyclotransferase (GGCT)/AIG2-like uncharacterized protein YtfP n=1 Tax=Neolewinella antarctica TaxID=442734 RepID=A0ABX0XC22_9BACT|nr:gamma-glutamylcyclotransferase family protein [Neolewinella antarctica]NJC26388.1 gamma-glutamylcyclotransferase (GGCT)/AIG2-like uncharacterized protein YtfP [Neolewinella antarctica]
MNLFVYGTLLSDVPSSMAKFLRRRATLLGPATVTGKLYDLGMYPGFKTSGSGEVYGELYELAAGSEKETITMLDAYEGVTGESEDEYRRVKIDCQLNGRKSVDAQTYVSKNIPSSAKRIATGKYAKFYATNKEHQRFVNGA